MSEELLDFYDANMTHLGVKARSAVHRDGDWHRVFHCFVIYRDSGGRDYLIVQKRGPHTETCPNMLDVSAAGHYAAGETMQDGVRELHEELGLDVRLEDLIPVGRRVSAAKYDHILDYQVADVFFYICDKPLPEYVYQQSEIAGLVKIDIAAAEQLFAGQIERIHCEAVGLDPAVIEVKLSDFIATQDNYFFKILLLAKRCLNGERPLFI